MAERIDKIEYLKADDSPATEKTGEKTKLFWDGPGEFLAIRVAQKLAADPIWKQIFGDNIDGYRRMDYPMRAAPVMRVYNDRYQKESESWFVTGDLLIDLIWPANLRRHQLEQLPDSVSSALLQQFRRPTFFSKLCDEVPGLNELGKRFSVDKSLGFDWQANENEVLPLTQITVNFRLDLRQWDRYLEETCRTKDSPYEQVLGDLRRLVGCIIGVNDEGEKEVSMGIEFKPGGNNNA